MRNITSAWRAASLVLFNLAPILSAVYPKTPPLASFTNKDSVQMDIQVQPNLAQKVNKFVADLIEGATLISRSKIKFVQREALTAIADRSTLQLLNNGLVEKQQKSHRNRTKATFGDARVLTVKEAHKKQKERANRERDKALATERYYALRGKVGFAKIVWKELHMAHDVFN